MPQVTSTIQLPRFYRHRSCDRNERSADYAARRLASANMPGMQDKQPQSEQWPRALNRAFELGMADGMSHGGWPVAALSFLVTLVVLVYVFVALPVKFCGRMVLSDFVKLAHRRFDGSDA